MTPKEKAEALIKRFNKVKIFISIEPSDIDIDIESVDCDANKQCALIAVDEIIDSILIIDLTAAENQFTYWEQVKTEIKKL
jgi:hypothetical protein